MFQAPPPSAETLPTLYSLDYRPLQQTGLVGALKSIQATLLARMLKKHIHGLDKRILELGCGGGHLLRGLARMGYRNLTGVDWVIPPAMREASQAINLVEADMTRYVPTHGIDALVVNNVLEHVLEPKALLTRYREFLSADGCILLLTPNARSMGHTLFGRYWSGLHAPRHVTVFTGPAVHELARVAGLRVLQLRGVSDPGGWAISVQSLWHAWRRGAKPRSNFGWPAIFGLMLCYPLAIIEGHTSSASSLFIALGHAHAGPGEAQGR
ncbi:MAG: class I SAM-dependent methyltransferase [Proteobacteria bacterium]|nr:class I SAM-dependent methyltransferase [Pseudomonadota bacterium]